MINILPFFAIILNAKILRQMSIALCGMDFQVIPEISLDLWVDRKKKEAKSNLSLSKFQKQKIQGFVVIDSNLK